MRSNPCVRLAMAVATLVVACGPMPAAGFAADLIPMEQSGPQIPNDVLELDQIIVRGKLSTQILNAMGPIHSMTDVIALLNRNGIKFKRGDARLLLGIVPPGVAQQLLDLPPGEPFIVPTPDGDTSISVIKRRVPAE